MLAPPFEILLVEDSPIDAMLLETAMRRASKHTETRVASNAASALDRLYQRGPFAAATVPDLVILDLGLPDGDGFDVLDEIRQSPKLTNLPVIVLSSSARQRDVVRAYALRANSYVAKPVDVEGFDRLAQSLASFWFENAQVPSRPVPTF